MAATGPEFIHAVPIQTRAQQLRARAQRLHEEWFAQPDSIDAKREFAYALEAWARETHNAKALAHAGSLLERKGDGLSQDASATPPASEQKKSGRSASNRSTAMENEEPCLG